MNNYYLVRHGQDQDNSRGILNGHRNQSLTKNGVKQALEVADKIKEEGITFDIVFSSPLKRTFRTAEIICETLNLKSPIKEELLIERDFGVMTGKAITSILDECMPDVLQTDHINYFLNPEGAETFPDLLKRARTLLDNLDSEYSNMNILFVTHGDIGQMIYAEYYKQEWKEVLKSFHFGNSELLLLSEDSPAEKVHVFKIKQYNSTK